MSHLNQTGFAALLAPLAGRDGREHAVAIVRATFVLNARGRLVPADEQEPVRIEDLFDGDPATAGPLEECDLAVYKPGTDVVVVGEAHAPRGRKASRVTVGVQVGPLSKSALVIGDRRWRRMLGIGPLWPSFPKPFTTMPLVWERAYGGIDPRTQKRKQPAFDQRNPVGCGFASGPIPFAVANAPLPNLVNPRWPWAAPHHRPKPWGLGPVGRHWWPRRRWAGTYDAKWKEDRAPLLPDDFDYRFFQCGSPGLVSEGHLAGDERVRLVNLSPEGVLEFTLPRLSLGLSIRRFRGPAERALAALDTIVLRPSQRRVSLVWRRAIPCRKSAREVTKVTSFAVYTPSARAFLGPAATRPIQEPVWTS